ncbi:hypothetical protein HOK021_10900 [Streptomyces hygroscopicus]|nr:hypothetical protein HOK021_10900 [Streptomyces hygroscopicus]
MRSIRSTAPTVPPAIHPDRPAAHTGRRSGRSPTVTYSWNEPRVPRVPAMEASTGIDGAPCGAPEVRGIMRDRSDRNGAADHPLPLPARSVPLRFTQETPPA